MIRSTKHYFSAANSGKLNIIQQFLDAYKTATQAYIDYIWNTQFLNEDGYICFDISSDILNYLPKFLNYQAIQFETVLSARALSAASNQAIGIVRGVVAFRRKNLYIIKKRKEENLPTTYYEKRLKPISKPILSDSFQAELSSKNIDFEVGKHFDLFVSLRSTGFKITNIPINFHKRSVHWQQKGGKQLAGILLHKNYIQLRWKLPNAPLKTEGKTVGADTGFTTILTLSDSQATATTDKDGHSLKSICEKLARRKRGSEGFKRAAAHRENFINYSINQLNTTDIKTIKLEEIVNLFHKNRTSRLMNGFTNSLIERKVLNMEEELGVRVLLQQSIYKSQRCFGCCIVLESNRKGKEYNCSCCGYKADADLNSARNNSLNLPKIPFDFRCLKLNITGFFWKESGCYDLSGKEIRVPCAEKS